MPPSGLANRRALLSGALGATASCVAKFALDPTSPVPATIGRACRSANLANGGVLVAERMLRSLLPASLVAGALEASDDPDRAAAAVAVCVAAELSARGICLLVMIGCNALMMGTFLDGMNESGSVAATGLATAANFAASAFYGIVLFHEAVDTTWIMGFAMIVAGVLLLSTVRLKPSA